MKGILKVIGAVTVLAGVAVAVYFAVTKFFLCDKESDNSDEISCFDEDEIVVDKTEDQPEEIAEEAEAKEETEE